MNTIKIEPYQNKYQDQVIQQAFPIMKVDSKFYFYSILAGNAEQGR